MCTLPGRDGEVTETIMLPPDSRAGVTVISIGDGEGVALDPLEEPVVLDWLEQAVAPDPLKEPVVLDWLEEPFAVDPLKEPVVLDWLEEPAAVDPLKEPGALVCLSAGSAQPVSRWQEITRAVMATTEVCAYERA
jgi:hypothetical protein